MLKSLQNIKNPLTRSIAGASGAFSLMVGVFALIIGIGELKETKKANYQLGVYGSLLGAVAGAVAGGATRYQPSSTAKSSQQKPQVTEEQAWQDWRNFVVTKKVPESQEITSFYLKPQDGQELPDFKPGQFLTIKLEIPEQSRPIIRTYSLSDYDRAAGYYRLSIKKEGVPKGLDVPPGVASNFMHDVIEEGSVIPCKPPNGKFFLNVADHTPAVLISNGVGITPMIAMAKACAQLNPQRHVWFLHGARNGEFHAFREAVLNLGQEYPNLHIHYKYSRPRPEDTGHYHSQGYVDKELLATQILPEMQQISGSTDAEYFLCGSPAFMDSLRSGLAELEVSEDRVFFESFSGGKTKGVTKKSSLGGSISSAEVVFASSGKTLTWNEGDGSLLEFAEANGLNPDFSCRQGVCLTCACQLRSGEVDYTEKPTTPADDGEVLICISQPKTSRVILDL